jgi:DNA-binding NarL/FixJ family response regulator
MLERSAADVRAWVFSRLAATAKKTRPAVKLNALTDRGLSNEEIAARLVVSPATAKTHVSRAMVKLHARDRAQLVVMAYETGLVKPGWLS